MVAVMSTLKRHSKAAGLKQKEIAAALGASQASVSEWFNRRSDIPVRYLEPLARLLNMSVADVVAVALALEDGE